MNVTTVTTIVIKTLRAATLMDHLFAHVFLASLEMEPFVKVCLIGECQ